MRGWCFLVALAIVAGSAAPARADNREDARREFAAGQAADKQRDWQNAIEHYLRANDLVPHPFAIYNIATDYERLGKLREAATWFDRYLEATSDPGDRERVNRIVLELRNRPARITVRSTPDRARVLIDGLPVGTTPYASTIKGGAHRIVIEKDGRKATKEITVAYAEPIDEQLALGGGTGTLRVQGQPFGALVSIDNAPAGTIPARLVLPEGEHNVKITNFGYTPYETTVTIAPDQDTPLDVQLIRALGQGPATPSILKIGYLIGIAGGADVRGNGGLLLFELGVRLTQYDGSVRIGRAGDVTAVDLFVRWTMTTGKLAPFLGAGYSFVKDGGGYTLIGGLRYDLARGERYGISVMAESGLRYYTGTVSDPGETPTTSSGLIVPVMASFLVLYK